MGFRTVVVNTHAKLSYRNNHLVFTSAEKTEVIHLSEIDALIVQTTDVSITSMLIKRLIDEKIVVLFCDEKALPNCMITDLYGRFDNTLQLKRQIAWEDDRKAVLGKAIIAEKIRNQADLLIKSEFREKGIRLIDMIGELEEGDPSNVEAHAARTYFNTLFGNQFTRSDETDINAGLNYGYSLLLATFAREIVLNGCLTQLGIIHGNQFNQYNLASDFMEPFRPAVDEIVYANREDNFRQLKRKLLEIFNRTWYYKRQYMYLTNIVSDYTRCLIRFLNGENEEFPHFNL